jgi:hypothetical protein
VECWLSLTSQANIDTDRVTFNNPLHAISELLELYSHGDLYRAPEKRRVVSEELVDFLKDDTCLQDLLFYRARKDLLIILENSLVQDTNQFTNYLEKQKSLVQSQLVQFKQLIWKSYRQIALKVIRENVNGSNSHYSQAELCNVINNLVSILTTMGMPMYECFTLVRNLFLADLKDFTASFAKLEQKVLMDPEPITISLKLNSNKLFNLITKSGEQALVLHGCSFHPIDHPKMNTVAVNININALSFSSGKELAMKKLNRALDIMSVVIGRDNLILEKKYQARKEDTSAELYDASQPLVTVSDRIVPLEFQVYKETISRLYDKGTEQTVNKVASSLNFLNKGLTDGSTESRFTALWSSLESLTSGVSQDKLGHDEHVLYAVLPCIGLDYPVKQLFALRGVAKELNWDAINVGPERVNFQNDNMATIYKALKNQGVQAEISRRLESYPYAKYRFLNFIDICNDPEKLGSKLQSHMQKVERQLHRMYRTRNAIVHNALIHDRLDLLVVNLEHYLRSALNAMVYEMKDIHSITSPEEAFSRIKYRAEQIISELDPFYQITAKKQISDIQDKLNAGKIQRADSRLEEWLALHS